MLIVVNPRIDPEATFAGWLKSNARFVAAMALWAAALLLVAFLGRPNGFDLDAWYSVSAAEGVPTYTAFGSEEACNAASPTSMPSCVSGRELHR